MAKLMSANIYFDLPGTAPIDVSEITNLRYEVERLCFTNYDSGNVCLHDGVSFEFDPLSATILETLRKTVSFMEDAQADVLVAAAKIIAEKQEGGG